MNGREKAHSIVIFDREDPTLYEHRVGLYDVIQRLLRPFIDKGDINLICKDDMGSLEEIDKNGRGFGIGILFPNGFGDFGDESV